MSDMNELGDMTPGELLKEVNKAINVVLIGGQSYKIGSRQLTRADLGELKRLRTQLQTEITADNGSLLDNTVVAVFDGR